MTYQTTGLPDGQLFRMAFAVGQNKFFEADMSESAWDRAVSMAQMIHIHGGTDHNMAVAACLAGPALFSAHPDESLGPDLMKLGQEVLCAQDPTMIPQLSETARLFIQVSAIHMLMDIIQKPVRANQEQCLEDYVRSLAYYKAARGSQDTYDLDAVMSRPARRLAAIVPNCACVWQNYAFEDQCVAA